MKKLIGLLLVVALLAGSLCGLAGCADKILENTEKDYFITGQFANWADATSGDTWKMEAVGVKDARVASIKDALKGAKYLYVKEATIESSGAGWGFKYTIDGVEVAFDGNQCIKVLRTVKGDEAPEFWAQNKESGEIKNLTPTTLYLPPYQETETTPGTGTWADNPGIFTAGKYNIVFVEYEDGTRAMGAIQATASTYELALVTDVGTIDDESFNQAAWQGVENYAKTNSKTYAYYQPASDSDEDRIASIRLAVKQGAKVIVCPGFMFAGAMKEVQDLYPDVKFVALDVSAFDMGNVINSNLYCVVYSEEQAGYLAGYAAVKDGYKKLGFLGGMEVPAVQRYGFGFVQGANDAAKELNTKVEIKYTYGGQFYGDATITSKMEGWYSAGTEVVFACGGGIYTSAVEAAKKYNAKVIGVDVDQSYIDDCIITSAMKGLQSSVESALAKFYAGNWAELGGKVATLGLLQGDYVGLPTAEKSWKLTKFTVAEYNAVVAKIKDGTIVVSADAVLIDDIQAKVSNVTIVVVK